MGVEYLDLSDALGKSPGYAYVAVASGTASVYCAGAVPLDAEGHLIGADDVVAQTLGVISNLQTVLARVGASAADVVKTTIFVAARRREALVRAWRAFADSGLARAPSTLVGVTCLGHEGQLVEIEAIASITHGPSN